MNSQQTVTIEQQGTSPPRGDEVSPIVRYIVGEMLKNARSRAATSIQRHNTLARQDCIAEYRAMPWLQRFLAGGQFLESCHQTAMSGKLLAFGEWAYQVRENGPWDHKPYIKKNFRQADPSASEQHWHHLNGSVYYFDIWSNIHYGYVGRACGFSASELLDGAGLEQIGSNIVGGRHFFRHPTSPGVKGLRRFDAPSDRLSIDMGIKLYPHDPTVTEILHLVQNTQGLSRRPLRTTR
ncbi:polymorphic toxin type 44 domain-containing protein [Pyxidicoccus xibeiensis]|uniref:polymorphic toxin type 44 domain-containing protein n=1 Tax=Pyxidicoccus xibeiensis TaxID=2906759 RepID=UPI0020A72B41|nr:polymorphic toxin type 44 domain-containing protein [Pyxidicoccus xibeiensis]MCP3140659.1 polymorphic toxin type 44 domain-containing protein [Pyxidicoccus xibeiensis]